MPESRFHGQVALVTGAGSAIDSPTEAIGVGAAIAQVLASQGCRVSVVDRDPAAGERTASLIQARGGVARAVVADVTLDHDCALAVDDAMATYGQVDVLVNSLGIFLAAGTVESIELDKLKRTMDVNVMSMILMARHAIPKMERGGAIVNISSNVAGRPNFDDVGYSVSKGAVVALTLTLAVQHGRAGIRVNCVAPGTVWTPMVERLYPGRTREELLAIREVRRNATLLGIDGTASDVAHSVAFLASDEARWVTGQTLVVDGGITLWPFSVQRPQP